MALDTYAGLLAAVGDWLDRGDLNPRIPDFVRLAEARFNRVLRLRCMELEAPLAVAAGARQVALPDSCREPLGLWRETPASRSRVKFVAAGSLIPEGSPGVPERWTIEAGAIAFSRPWAVGEILGLSCLGRLALSETAPTNGLLRDHPDIYLFGALAEAAPYLRDAEMLALTQARLEAAMVEARMKDARSHSLSILACEPALIGVG